MDGLYSGMSVGLGFILFFILLSIVWCIFQSIKKRMLPKNNSIDLGEFINHKVEDRRIENRFDIVWPVSIEIDNEIMKAETKDLSRSGAFIKCSKPLMPGKQFVLTIELPEKGPISLNSEVVWSNSNIPEEKVVARGMGIRYIQNKIENIELLKSVLDEHLAVKNKNTLQSSAFI